MTTTTGAAPMSAAEVVSLLSNLAKIESTIRGADSKVVAEILSARTAVSAMAEREAALVKEVDALRALVSEWNGEAANLERAGVNAPYYDKGKASGFRQCADNLRTALARAEARDG